MDMEAKRLLALKEDLKRDLEAIERVERMMAFKNGSLSIPDDRQAVLKLIPEQIVDVYDPGEQDDAASVGSLRGTIDAVINAQPEVRWTTQKMLTHLRNINFPLRAKEPIYSVGQTLNVLVKAGRIKLARKGGGSTPNIYRGKSMKADTITHIGPIVEVSE